MRRYFLKPEVLAMRTLDLTLLRRDGQMLPVEVSLDHWKDKDMRRTIAKICDLTERKKLEASLRHRATHDELTGLPNC
jgi:PleD family two-component response regulator